MGPDLGPGDAHANESHAFGTRELLQVHQSKLTVSVGGQQAILTAGDAIVFAGDVEHGLRQRREELGPFSLAVLTCGPTGTEAAPGAASTNLTSLRSARSAALSGRDAGRRARYTDRQHTSATGPAE